MLAKHADEAGAWLHGGKVFRYSDETAEAVASGEKLLKESGTIYESFADMMSPDDAAKYLDFLENGSREGLTSAELADALLVSQKVEYDDVWDLRNVGDLLESGSSSYSLLPSEGEIGTYRELLDAGEVGDNITPHHMPSAEYMSQYGVGREDGLCMNMEMPSPGTGGRHRLTDTYGRNMTDAEKAYYYSLSPRDALAYDIANMRQIYQSQGLYSEIRPKLQEYIKKYMELMPELFDK